MKKNNATIRQLDETSALHFIKTFSDTAREPFLILNSDLKVVGANASFYKQFQVTQEDTENQLIYDLGNGQWDIPELRKLLGDILPKKKVFNDYEVSHIFPNIGLKIMLLNARQLDTTNQILLAIEDITAKREFERKAISYTKDLEVKVAERTKELNDRVKDLEELTQVMVGRELKMSELKKEIARIRKLKKLNGNNGNNHPLG